MRSREEINKAPSYPEAKMVELLLDIRELLMKDKIIPEKGKRGRPKKIQ